MSQAKLFADEHVYVRWNEETPLRASSEVVRCGVCKMGRTKKLTLAHCTFRHKFRRDCWLEEFACLKCLGKTLGAPTADLAKMRMIHHRDQNRAFCPGVFAALDSLKNTGILSHHQLLADAIASDAAGQQWAPIFVGKLAKIALVFAADPELTKAYVWLKRNPDKIAHHPELHGMSAKFSGLCEEWPSLRDRDVVKKIMDAS